MTSDALRTTTAVGGVWVSPGGGTHDELDSDSDRLGKKRRDNNPSSFRPLRFRQSSDLKQMDLHMEGPVREALVLALAYIVLDTLIIHLPVSRSLILKYFNPSSNTRAAQTRLVGQVAARTVGCVFLAMMFPSAIRTLLDPTMRVLHESELYHTSEDSLRCIQVAAAYFIYDTYICTFRYAENGFPFLVHAVLCCMAYLYPLYTGNMHYQGANFLCWECSTPFLYLRWATIKGKFFRSESKKKAWQNASNVLFAMAFFACRVVSGPWQSWAYFQASGWDLARGDGAGISSTVTWAYRSAMLVLNGLNYWWFSAIMRVALGKGSGEQTEQKD